MPQDDDLFVNDDLNNSAENRLNHVLFGLFINRHFREHVLQRLGIPDGLHVLQASKPSVGKAGFCD